MGTITNELGAVVAPDALAPAGRTTYVFGFRDVTVLDAPGPTPGTTTEPRILAQKGHVQHSAPLIFFDENDAIQITLSNLGLAVRPDLTDPHTIHWHGFRNALPIFDGVPEMSISVAPGSDFPYYYHPTDPGTYMYHCHNEDVEHVQMGMDGIVFVRPAQNKTGNGAGAPVARYNGGAAGAAGLRLQRRRGARRPALDGLRPRVRHLPQRVLGAVALRRRPHPGERLERLPRRLLPDERPLLSRHARAQRRRHRPDAPAT